MQRFLSYETSSAASERAAADVDVQAAADVGRKRKEARHRTDKGKRKKGHFSCPFCIFVFPKKVEYAILLRKYKKEDQIGRDYAARESSRRGNEKKAHFIAVVCIHFDALYPVPDFVWQDTESE